jgi:glutaminyl-tRNA synthetase
VIKNAFIEPDLANAKPGFGYQFIRKGYFSLDIDSSPDHLVFNRTVTLKDAWAKEISKS